MILWISIWILIKVTNESSSYKEVFPNPYFQVNQATILVGGMESTLEYVTLMYDEAMDTQHLDVGVGVTGSSFNMEGYQFGWDIRAPSLNHTALIIEVEAKYPPSTITYINLKYLITNQTYINVDYTSLTLNQSSYSVGDATSTQATSCDPLSCRQSSFTLYYKAQNTGEKLRVLAFLAGFYVGNIAGSNSTNPLHNYDEPNYFGISLYPKDIKSNNFTLVITVYGWAELELVSLYYLSFQENNLNGYYSRVTYGTSQLGCYYDADGCGVNRTVNSNTEFDTGRTYVQNLHEENYFMGINRFVFTAEQIGNASNYTSITSGQFYILSTSLNEDKYTNQFQFTGNSNDQFTIRYAYFLYNTVDCPVTTNIYHWSDKVRCGDSCGNKFYPTVDNICLMCHDTCYRCTGPANTECTACYNSQIRVLSGTQCVCNVSVGVYDDGTSDKCQQCHYSCETCSYSSDSSCLSCSATNKRYDDGNSSCPCEDNYYDDGTSTCDNCHYSCLTCYGGSWKHCLTCDPANNRSINIADDSCPCDEGYYSTNVAVCELCHHSCKTCSKNPYNCTSCEAGDNRPSSPTGSNECPCNDGFYDTGLYSYCEPCTGVCQKCTGPTSSDCTGCDSSLNRALEGSNCKCIGGYFQHNSTCYACHFSCENCTDASMYSCQTCDNTYERQFKNTTGECICGDGYYDDYSNVQCVLCNYTCLTCNVSSTNCTSCESTHFRELTGSSCSCLYGYVDVLLTGACSICHYSCQTCTDVDDNSCQTCNTTIRDKTGSQCLCKSNTYDDGMNEECPTCHENCVQCDGGDDNDCLTCDSINKRNQSATMPNYCACQTGYYDVGVPLCALCDPTCYTCDVISTNCTTCQSAQHRTISASHECVCDVGYFDSGAPTCLPCVSSCYSCDVLADNCTACQGVRTLSGSDCICMDGYYVDNADVCQSCDYSVCETCVDSATKCLSCFSNTYRQLDNDNCLCMFGYYDDSVAVCQSCPYYCENCTVGAVCLECDPLSNRLLVNDTCDCDDGYYEDGVSLICPQCWLQCEECSFYSVCTACRTSDHRYLDIDDCVCEDSYYSVSGTSICDSCHYSCATCSGPSAIECTSCVAGRTPNNASECECNYGMLETNQTCYGCDLICEDCDGSATNCTACTSPLVLFNNTCICGSGHYQNGGSCLPCDGSCEQCTISSTTCTKCYASQQTHLLSNTCICNDGYYQNSTTYVCTLCHSSCKYCDDGTSTDCTECDATQHRQLHGTSCKCMSHYYEYAGSCLSCHHLCSECVGSSKYNCSECYSGYVLIGSLCKQVVQCANYLYDGECVNECPDGSYATLPEHECWKCEWPCLTCLSDTRCLSCEQDTYYYKQDEYCYPTCQTGSYPSNGQCISCPSSCVRCGQVDDSVICSQCEEGSYIGDDNTCWDSCPSKTHITSGSKCIKCVKNCLQCTALSSTACTSCLHGYSLLGSECFRDCPVGYYRQNYICQQCQPQCVECYENRCVNCIDGYYLHQQQCIQMGYYLNQNNKLKPCHPNCKTCTNSSFSSCIACNSYRGDDSELAIDGYCDCKEGSVDIGEGVCDRKVLAQVQTAKYVLISFTSSSVFFAAVTGSIAVNFVPMFASCNYLQLYSMLYYVNSSVLLQTDSTLQDYLSYNPNVYINKGQSKRLLLSTQNHQSLFLRGNQYEYFFDWGFHFLVVAAGVWVIGGVLLLLRGCCCDQEDGEQEESQIRKYFRRFVRVYHQSVAIVLHYLCYTELTLFGVAWIKMTIGLESQLDVGKTVGSVIILLYLFAYIIRLFIGAIKSSSSTSLLLALHQATKSHPLHRLYIPILMLRTQIITVLLVTLSHDPQAQVLSAFLIFLIFCFYSLCCCPYQTGLRVFMHLQEIIMVIQFGCLFGAVYQMETYGGSILTPFYTLIALNYLQVILIMMMVAIVGFNLGKQKLCKSNAVNQQTIGVNESHEQLGTHMDNHSNIFDQAQTENEKIIYKKYRIKKLQPI